VSEGPRWRYPEGAEAPNDDFRREIEKAVNAYLSLKAARADRYSRKVTQGLLDDLGGAAGTLRDELRAFAFGESGDHGTAQMLLGRDLRQLTLLARIVGKLASDCCRAAAMKPTEKRGGGRKSEFLFRMLLFDVCDIYRGHCGEEPTASHSDEYETATGTVLPLCRMIANAVGKAKMTDSALVDEIHDAKRIQRRKLAPNTAN
jgi:hypothetical protein